MMCKVKGCKFYGKKMANWEAHAIEAHQLNMSVHDGLPAISKTLMKSASADAKYRKPQPCLYPDCKKRNSMFMRLNRHLRIHGLSEQRYKLILNM